MTLMNTHTHTLKRIHTCERTRANICLFGFSDREAESPSPANNNGNHNKNNRVTIKRAANYTPDSRRTLIKQCSNCQSHPQSPSRNKSSSSSQSSKSSTFFSPEPKTSPTADTMCPPGLLAPSFNTSDSSKTAEETLSVFKLERV